MTVRDISNIRVQNAYTQVSQTAAEAPLEVSLKEKQNADVVDFANIKEKETLIEVMKRLSDAENAVKTKPTIPKGQAAQLTRRLVGASMQMEVRSVMSEVSKCLSSLSGMAALCDKEDKQKIEALIRQLNKVMDRASGKIKDLNQEDVLRARRKRAQKENKQKRAEELKEELRSKEMKRGYREQGYLMGTMRCGMLQLTQNGQWAHGGPQAATEGEIEVLAEAVAAAEALAPGEDCAVVGESASAGDGTDG